MFSSADFSKDLKIQKLNYQYGEEVDQTLIQSHLSAIQNVNLHHLSNDDQKKAFWINCYNGLTNYWIIHFGIKEQMREIADIFSRPSINIGSYSFSLDDIEHGILRQNARPRFEKQDDRFQLMVEQVDPRIHFALNCGALSCPPIAFYNSKQIETQLDLAETVFVEQEFIVDNNNKQIICSAIFDWYRADFGEHYLNDPSYHSYQVSIKPYDWRI